jgi:hypothetical protein
MLGVTSGSERLIEPRKTQTTAMTVAMRVKARAIPSITARMRDVSGGGGGGSTSRLYKDMLSQLWVAVADRPGDSGASTAGYETDPEGIGSIGMSDET